MSNVLFDPAREGFLKGEIVFGATVNGGSGNPTIKASLVRGYTFSAAHKFVSDVTGAGGTLDSTATLSSLTFTNGVGGSADITWSSVSNGSLSVPAIIVYQASAVTGGSDVASSAQRLISYIDGKCNVTAAAGFTTGATSITVAPLTTALASGTTVTFGSVVATLSSPATLGATSLTVSATPTGTVTAGTVGTSSAQGGIPVTPNGGNISYAIDIASGNKLFKL